MDNYNEFIELLKSFKRENNIGESEDKHSPSILYNGFSCENLDDISAYSLHLENQCSKAISDIKKGVDKLMVERDNVHMLDIYFNGKLDDFKEVQEVIEKRDADNEKRRVKYHIAALDGKYNGILLDADGIEMYNQFRDAVRGEELYYRNSIDREGLLEYCSPEIKFLKDNANIFFILAEKEQRDIIKKAKQKLEELHYLYCPPQKEENNKVAKDNGKQVIDFRSQLHYENKDALMMKLHEMFKGRKGKFIAITLKALECMKILPYLELNRSVVYDAMRLEFGEGIGSNQSFDPILNNLKSKDSAYYEKSAYVAGLRQQISILEAVK